MIALVTFAVLFGLADRFAGGGWPWLDNHLPGRPVVYGTVLIMAVAYFVFNSPGMTVMSLGWGIYRSLKWSLFAPNTLTPVTAREIMGCVARHLLVIIPAVCVWAWFRGDLIWLWGASVLYAGLVTLYAVRMGKAKAKALNENRPMPDMSTFAELSRGALFGALFSGVIV